MHYLVQATNDSEDEEFDSQAVHQVKRRDRRRGLVGRMFPG
jgi:hypothetical protein